MTLNKHLTLLIATGSLLTAAIVSMQIPTTLDAKVKITTNQSYKKTSFLINSNRNAYVWNAKYNQKLHNLKNYPRTNFYSTKRVTIRTNHYFGSYYYIHNANNKIKGYVWHGFLIKGTYYKGGFYRYPTFNVLLSNQPYRRGGMSRIGEWDASGVYASSNRIHGTVNQNELKPFATTPALNDQKQALTYLKQNWSYLPEMLNYGQHNGARIVMRKVYYGTNQWLKVPMIDILNGPAISGNWEEINPFAAVLDLSKLPNGAKPIANYDVSQVTVLPLGSRAFDFPDPSAQVTNNNSGPITRIYGNNLGPNHNLSLVDLNRWLHYVPTNDIFKLSNTQPTLKDGIWYFAPSFESGVGSGTHLQQMLNQINPTQSPYYRTMTGEGFIQAHYENGHWHEQFELSTNLPAFNKGNGITLTISKMITKSSGSSSYTTADNANAKIVKHFDSNDADVSDYFFKPANYYETFLNND